MFVCRFFLHLVFVTASAIKLCIACPFVQGKVEMESLQPRDGWHSSIQFSENLENLLLIFQEARRVF